MTAIQNQFQGPIPILKRDVVERFHARAKYIPDQNGNMILAMVQGFSYPVFNPDGSDPDEDTRSERFRIRREEGEEPAAADIERATRRAKINAFDKILCNHDLDTFATFTYDPQKIGNTASWEDCYEHLRVWLSNRVSRKGLKYVIVPERHIKGGIHFHGILNSSALKMERAHSAKTGRALTINGRPLYNIADWKYGYSTAEIISCGEHDRTKVAKYIFKYMGKQGGQKIGGRYLLTGGELVEPVYVYDQSVDTFITSAPPAYSREVDLGEGKKYYEFSYI